tara:strand:+ start:299 stop:835 length:537 start_codon:yes stop_codon:yes gene_type:complete
MKIKLNAVRLSFPQLFEAKTVNGEGKPAFSAAFLISPKDPQIAMINTAITTVAAEKWGAKADAILKTIRAADKTCLHSGDLKSNYDGFEGMMYISARNPLKPSVVDTNRSPLVAEDGRPYAGCYVNAVLELWTQDNNYGKRVNATLMGVQFYQDGESFVGGGVADADDFDDLTIEDLV